MTFFYPIIITAFIILAFFFIISVKNFRRRRPFRASIQMLFTLSALLSLLLGLSLLLTTWGYTQLIYEEKIATIDVTKIQDQQFTIKLLFADQQSFQYTILGDEIYIDAHILKWHPWANIMGFKTLFKLDRIGGRYFSYQDEMNKKRSLYPFKSIHQYDLFDISKKTLWLNWLVDAKYGNATFVPLKNQQHLLLTLSNSGLIMRETMD